MRFTPREYQTDAAKHLLANPRCALLADIGTGKTAIILSVLRALKRRGVRNKTLVLTTKRIMLDVWPDEIEKWDQFKGLTYSVLHGPHKAKRADEKTDIHLLNFDALPWARDVGLLHNYDTLVVDESSKMKNWTAPCRMGILKKYLQLFRRRYILTGSPTPRTLIDMFAQMYIVDRGKSLGKFVTYFREEYFINKSRNQNYEVWVPRKNAERDIVEAIAKSCYRLDGSTLLELPELVVNDVVVKLPTALRSSMLAELGKCGSPAEALNTGRQMAGGFAADGTPIHSCKMDALRDLVDELSGSPALVFFYYRSEGEAIAKEFGCPLIYGGVSDKVARKARLDWNAGKLPLLAMQPASTGHGLNLQAGGHHVIYYSLTTNQDDYGQSIGRVRRPGQQSDRVFVHRLLANLPVERALVQMLERKTASQGSFLREVAALTEAYAVLGD